MGKVEIKVNYGEVGRLLKSPELTEGVLAAAEQLRERCGDGYQVDDHAMPTRQVCSVFTADRKAINSNAKHNTLLKALGEVSNGD